MRRQVTGGRVDVTIGMFRGKRDAISRPAPVAIRAHQIVFMPLGRHRQRSDGGRWRSAMSACGKRPLQAGMGATVPPQRLSGSGRKPPKPRERQTGTRSAATHENHHRRAVRDVVANRHRTADTPNLAAQGQSVSRKTVAEVPLTGLSFLRPWLSPVPRRRRGRGRVPWPACFVAGHHGR